MMRVPPFQARKEKFTGVMALKVIFLLFIGICVSRSCFGAMAPVDEKISSDLKTSFIQQIEFEKETFPYQHYFEAAAKKYDLPLPFILAVARGESFFRPDIVGGHKDTGLMQVIPSTGKIYGYTQQDLKDPRKNIDAGVHYLSDLYRTLKDPYLTLAAYNCGPDDVDVATRQVRADCAEYVKYIYQHYTKVMQRVRSGEREYASKLSTFTLAAFHHVSDVEPFTTMITQKVPHIKLDMFREEITDKNGLLMITYRLILSYKDLTEKASLCKQIEQKTGFQFCK